MQIKPEFVTTEHISNETNSGFIINNLQSLTRLIIPGFH